MSTKKTTVSELERASKHNATFTTLQYKGGPEQPELTLECVQNPNTYVYYWFLNNSNTRGRKEITRTEASDLLKEYNVHSS